MAFTDSGRFITNGNETSQTSTAFPISSATAADELGVIAIALDNLATTDGQTSNVTSVSDSKGNTWNKLGEYTNTVGGAAADGATIAVWYSVFSSALTTSDTVTANYSSSVVAKAAMAWSYTKGASTTVALAGSLQVLGNDNSDAGSMTVSGLTNGEYLFFRAIASETNTVGSTPTSSYTSFNVESGNGGSEKGHVNLNIEFIILTGTSSTSDPTMGDTSADRASVFMALKETASQSAVLTGTITPTATEADIVAGGKTLIITLTGDTWIAAGALSFDLQRDEIIAGIDSAQSEATGWDLVPKATQSLAGVVRTSDTVVTITWDAFATYDITATETITVTVPGTAVTGGSPIVATPTFTVTATGGASSKLGLLGVG